ncbi:MAG: hypothetical protein HY084_11805 [Gemmatimonadetes bacterium]|nr:hypothetical protein [Gemmatimonadota bacterium]
MLFQFTTVAAFLVVVAGAMHPGSYMARLGSPSGAKTPGGMVMVTNAKDVTLTLSGDNAGGSRAWYVHKGTCKDDRGIVGSNDMFPAFQISEKGEGRAKATLATPLVDGTNYFVAVHASAEDVKTIVACGELKPEH